MEIAQAAGWKVHSRPRAPPSAMSRPAPADGTFHPPSRCPTCPGHLVAAHGGATSAAGFSRSAADIAADRPRRAGWPAPPTKPSRPRHGTARSGRGQRSQPHPARPAAPPGRSDHNPDQHRRRMGPALPQAQRAGRQPAEVLERKGPQARAPPTRAAPRSARRWPDVILAGPFHRTGHGAGQDHPAGATIRRSFGRRKTRHRQQVVLSATASHGSQPGPRDGGLCAVGSSRE